MDLLTCFFFKKKESWLEDLKRAQNEEIEESKSNQIPRTSSKPETQPIPRTSSKSESQPFKLNTNANVNSKTASGLNSFLTREQRAMLKNSSIEENKIPEERTETQFEQQNIDKIKKEQEGANKIAMEIKQRQLKEEVEKQKKDKIEQEFQALTDDFEKQVIFFFFFLHILNSKVHK